MYHMTHGGVSRYRKFAWFFSEILGREITPQESEEWESVFASYSLEEVKRCALSFRAWKGSYRLGRQAPYVRVFRLSHRRTAFHFSTLRKLSHFFRLILGSSASQSPGPRQYRPGN